MKKILLFLMVLLASLSAWAQNGIPIDSSNFPDANFRNYLLSRPYGSDGVLTDGEIAAIITIDVASKSIADLTGIEHFTALQFNQLTELDVSQNTALIFLACNNNQLTALDVSHNTALDKLHCFNNQRVEDLRSLVQDESNGSASMRNFIRRNNKYINPKDNSH